MTETHDHQERIRLENELDRLTRRLDSLLDVLRAAQYLVDAIHVQNGIEGLETPQDATSGGLFGEAYANLRAALRNHHRPNGN
jgi:hypothetical protein